MAANNSHNLRAVRIAGMIVHLLLVKYFDCVALQVLGKARGQTCLSGIGRECGGQYRFCQEVSQLIISARLLWMVYNTHFRTQTPPGNEAASPGPGNEAASPGPGNEAASPGPGNEAASPGPGNKAASPGPGNEAASPGPGNKAASLGLGTRLLALGPGTRLLAWARERGCYVSLGLGTRLSTAYAIFSSGMWQERSVRTY